MNCFPHDIEKKLKYYEIVPDISRHFKTNIKTHTLKFLEQKFHGIWKLNLNNFIIFNVLSIEFKDLLLRISDDHCFFFP